MRHWYGQNYNKGTHTNKNTCNPPLRMKGGTRRLHLTFLLELRSLPASEMLD